MSINLKFICLIIFILLGWTNLSNGAEKLTPQNQQKDVQRVLGIVLEEMPDLTQEIQETIQNPEAELHCIGGAVAAIFKGGSALCFDVLNQGKSYVLNQIGAGMGAGIDAGVMSYKCNDSDPKGIYVFPHANVSFLVAGMGAGVMMDAIKRKEDGKMIICSQVYAGAILGKNGLNANALKINVSTQAFLSGVSIAPLPDSVTKFLHSRMEEILESAKDAQNSSDQEEKVEKVNAIKEIFSQALKSLKNN